MSKQFPIYLKHVLSGKPKTLGDAVKIALKSAKTLKRSIKSSRIVPIPKTGYILPLMPIFSDLSALETISGGAATIAKTENKTMVSMQWERTLSSSI